MAINSGNAAVYSWECIGLDADERQLAEDIIEKGPTASVKRLDRRDRQRNAHDMREEGYDLYAAHDSHRWSPVTHYLEPYL
ncbi:MAG: hypothetical protein R3B54_09640 [Bdellovibrionota bacterium]